MVSSTTIFRTSAEAASDPRQIARIAASLADELMRIKIFLKVPMAACCLRPKQCHVLMPRLRHWPDRWPKPGPHCGRRHPSCSLPDPTGLTLNIRPLKVSGSVPPALHSLPQHYP